MYEILEGGRSGIFREENCIIRPADTWTEHVHHFLKYLHSEGFNKVPFPFGINDDGNERLSYVEGTVYNELLPDDIKSDETLVSVCRLVKQFHDFGEKYIKTLTGKEQWMLPVRMPIETMCHGDLAPYNIAVCGNVAVGIIDFDTLHPGPRMWDIAYSLYRWIPLMAPDNPENFGNEDDKHRRLKLFMGTYGLRDMNNKQVIECVIQRVEYLICFMEKEAENGNISFIQNIAAGHLAQYRKDVMYMKETNLNTGLREPTR